VRACWMGIMFLLDSSSYVLTATRLMPIYRDRAYTPVMYPTRISVRTVRACCLAAICDAMCVCVCVCVCVISDHPSCCLLIAALTSPQVEHTCVDQAMRMMTGDDPHSRAFHQLL